VLLVIDLLRILYARSCEVCLVPLPPSSAHTLLEFVINISTERPSSSPTLLLNSVFGTHRPTQATIVRSLQRNIATHSACPLFGPCRMQVSRCGSGVGACVIVKGSNAPLREDDDAEGGDSWPLKRVQNCMGSFV